MISQESALFPLLIFLAILFFAFFAWCILSSCMGRPILSAISDLWEMLVVGARSTGGTDHVRHRLNRWEDDDLLEMEYRGRPRLQ